MPLTYNNFFEHEARKRIGEEIDRHTEVLAGGVADWGIYQLTVGKITGLRQALDCLDAAHDELEKR